MKLRESLNQIYESIRQREAVAPIIRVYIADYLLTLTEINLHREYIKNIGFEGLTSLKKLSLKFNQLSHLGNKPFEGLTSLEELHLNNNQLARLDNNPFEGLTSLKILCLENNQLAHLDNKPFEGLTSLKRIYLDNNQLTHLDNKPFEGLTSLKELYLNRNQLAKLDNKLFDGLKSLCELSLHDNKFEIFSLVPFYLSNIRLVLCSKSKLSNFKLKVRIFLLCIFISCLLYITVAACNFLKPSFLKVFRDYIISMLFFLFLGFKIE